MTRILTGLAILLVLSPAFAQKAVVGSGKIITETRKPAEFDQIDLRISGDTHITIGKSTGLEITGDDNILPLIKTEVDERRLVIRAEREFKTSRTPNLKITVPDLKAAVLSGSGDMHISKADSQKLALNISGSGDLYFDGKAELLSARITGSGNMRLSGNAEQLTANISGSGDLHFNGKAESLAAGITGSGDMRLSGSAKQLSASISGAGDINGFDLATESATVTITGSGDVRVNVTGALAVEIFGSGDVLYHGDPTISKQVHGSGDVRQRD